MKGGTPTHRALCLGAAIMLVGLFGCSRAEPEPGPPNEAARFDNDRPFAEPDELVSEGGVLEAAITVAERTVDVSGFEVTAKAYEDGTLMGPTLRLAPGDTLRLELRNELDEFTNIHVHGLHVSPEGESDNIFRHIHPQTSGRVVVEIPADHEPGLFWYHSHAHGFSEEQVFAGLSGMIVIDGLTELLPLDLQDVEQRVFALKDVQVEGDRIVTDDIDSNAPTNRTINGLVRPRISAAPGQTQLWRFANIGADIFYELAIEGLEFTVVAEDGWPVTAVWNSSTLVLPPGKRFEVLVAFPEAGSYELETLEYRQGDDVYPRDVLGTVEVSGDAQETVTLDEGTSVYGAQDLSEVEIAEERTVVFSEDEENNTFFIDGKSFDPDRVDVSPQLGTVEEWLVENTSDEQHPFHIHVNDFQVMEIDREAAPLHGRQDTVILQPGGSVLIRIPFEDFTGRFVFHCHILAHEDAGMMAVVDVVP